MRNLFTTVFAVLFCVFLHASANAEPWDGTSNIDWYSPSESSFTLSNETQLAGLAQIVNSGTDNFAGKTIVIDADMDLNGTAQQWTPIGTVQNPFSGQLYGNGHTIDGMNITVTTDTVFVSLAYGLIGYGSDAHISSLHIGSNCKIDVTDTVTSLSQPIIYIGGIIAYNTYLSADSLFIDSCSSACEIKSLSPNLLYVGGIIGYSDTPYMLFTACSNSGNLISNTEYSNGYNCASYVGGIISTSPKSDFLNCSNTGTIAAHSYTNGYAGGIFSQRTGSTFDTIRLENCINEGEIISTSHKYGAISGGLFATTFPHNSQVIVKNCINAADVRTTSSSSTGYCGGLIGRANAVQLEKSINKGNVTGKSDPQFAGHEKLTQMYSGGLLGFANNGDIVIRNCANTGNVLGHATSNKICVGGLAGSIENYFGPIITVSNSYNAGKIFTDTLYCASGIIGFHPEVVPVYSFVYSIENPVTRDSGVTWQNDVELADVSIGGKAEIRTSKYMKSLEFVDLLNSDQEDKPWLADSVPNTNFGYPVINPASASGIFETLSATETAVFPNPSNNFINLPILNDLPPTSKIIVRSINGDILSETDNSAKQINISTLPVGSYFIEIRSGREIYFARFIRQ